MGRTVGEAPSLVTGTGARPELRPDRRSLAFANVDYSFLQRVAAEWPRGLDVPDHVAGLLDVARSLFVQAYFVYDFFTVSVVWGSSGSRRHSWTAYNELTARWGSGGSSMRLREPTC